MREGKKQERRVLFAAICHLAWPAILEQAFQAIVMYVDTAMVGQLGAHASASVGLTTTVVWLMCSPMWAMGVGIVACVSRAMGAGERDRVRAAVSQTAIITVILSLVLAAVTLGISPVLPVLMGADPEIRSDASWYFAIICMPMLFRVASILFAAVLRGIGEMKKPMLINTLMNLVNIVLNYLLIYDSGVLRIGGLAIPHWGAGLGVRGAAIATALSFVLGGTLMFVTVMRHAEIRPARLFAYHASVMNQCIRIGIPVMFQRVTTCLGQVVFSMLVTSLGTVALATHSIALTVEELFYIFGYGMQAAATTLAGNALGERNRRKLEQMSVMVTIMTVALMTMSGTLLFLLANPMMRIFTKDAAVIAGGTVVLRIVAVSEPLFGMRIILEGLFNGVGETKLPFWDSVLTMWAVRVLFTAICVNIFHLGLEAVWCCMVADNVSCALLLAVQYYGGKWKERLWTN